MILMRRGYLWGWQLDDGYRAIMYDHMTEEELDKRNYVHEFLDPCVREAKCGWDAIVYCVCDNNGQDRREFVLMFANKNDTPHMARWINVTGDSKGAIAEAVWSLVFS